MEKQKWEYYHEYVTRKNMTERMNVLGKKGWRCINILTYVWYKHSPPEEVSANQITATDEFMLIFERKINN